MSFLDWMYEFALQYGYVGVFTISFLGALSIIVPIPYTLFLFFLGGFLNPVLVAIFAGLGAAAGEFSGYVLGYYGQKILSEERKRKINFIKRVFERYGYIAIFLFALTPLPDDLLFIPLGMMRYSILKACIPALLGKILMSFIIAYSGQLSIGFIRDLFGEGGWSAAILTTVLLAVVIFAIIKIDWEHLLQKYVTKESEKKS